MLDCMNQNITALLALTQHLKTEQLANPFSAETMAKKLHIKVTTFRRPKNITAETSNIE